MPKRVLGSVFGLATLFAGAAWAQVRLGSEFQVNSYTTSLQSGASIAYDPLGNFVVVWASVGQDGSGTGVFARWYDAAGAPVGADEFRVNTYTLSGQSDPVAAADGNGGLVVVWQSYGQDGSFEGIYAKRYDSSGTPGAEFRVNSQTVSSQSRPSVATDPAGNFVVVWNAISDGSSFGVVGQRYDALGVAQGSNFQVNSFTTGFQYKPDVAAFADGFVVVWYSVGQDGSGAGVFGQRYDAFGAAQGAEFRVNVHTTLYQSYPAVAADAAGNFVVVWQSGLQDGGDDGVFARRYDAAGTPQGGEFRVNVYTTGDQTHPTVSVDAKGFVAVWRSSGQDGSSTGIFARRYDTSGAPQGDEFLVNSYTTSFQTRPAIASDASGRFVVAWLSNGQDGSSYGVFGQRFLPDVIFADGFESGGLSAWSTSATDGGDLSVSSAGAMKFTLAGLRGIVDDTAGLYVQDDSPGDEGRYRARFYLDPNGFDPGEVSGARRTRVFILFEEAPTRRLAAIVLRRQNGVYAMMGRARLDDNSQADTGFFPVSDAPHFVELDWTMSSGPDADDGTFELWIDGASVSTLAGLDNSTSTVDFVRLGALSVKATAQGTLYWDEFESRRLNYIGP